MSDTTPARSADSFDARLDQQIVNTRAALDATRAHLPGPVYGNLAAELNALVGGIYYLRDVLGCGGEDA